MARVTFFEFIVRRRFATDERCRMNMTGGVTALTYQIDGEDKKTIAAEHPDDPVEEMMEEGWEPLTPRPAEIDYEPDERGEPYGFGRDAEFLLLDLTFSAVATCECRVSGELERQPFTLGGKYGDEQAPEFWLEIPAEESSEEGDAGSEPDEPVRLKPEKEEIPGQVTLTWILSVPCRGKGCTGDAECRFEFSVRYMYREG